MGSKWRKAKLALGLNICLYVPKTLEEGPATAPSAAGRVSDALPLSPASGRSSDSRVNMPTTPTPSSSGLRLPKHSLKSSKKTCAICLTSMKPGQGLAIFTAECSHSFHFQCITSNVKHGNQICPVCRAKWKEIPFQSPVVEIPQERARANRVLWPQDDTWMAALRRPPPPPRVDSNRHSSPFHLAEPGVFDDDELVDPEPICANKNPPGNTANVHSMAPVEVKTYPEISAVSNSASHKDFAVLIHLKAPKAEGVPHFELNQGDYLGTQNSRAPIDLVTVLDVSGSMAGTKLALLKRAMGFVIQHLGPSDRLSVIAFSSSARRLFPLRKMTDTGRHEALQAVNSLSSNGGTNIAEALRKGAKIMTERRSKNIVSSIILLSDGQDTYTVNSPRGANPRINHPSLLPASMHRSNGTGLHIPVHTFGFGADHDAVAMHSISESSGGTFSFIEAEGVIQDAFAQCIGGLLSVVVQELRMEMECVHPKLQLGSIKAGSYKSSLNSNKRAGVIEVGDLYAEEERDFLVTLDIPADVLSNDMRLLNVKCIYNDPISKTTVTMDRAGDVKIERPKLTGQVEVSMDVDKQRNRLRAAEAMAEAKATADRGDLSAAVSIVEQSRKELAESVSARAGDRLCVALDAELKEMQDRMANRRIYETSGRAYVLSGLSSHSWQRATARGDSTETTSLMHAYQTPSMTEMINRSQTLILGSPSPRPSLRQAQSFPARPQPR